MFSIRTSFKNCHFTRCTSTANVIRRDVDVFGKQCFSLSYIALSVLLRYLLETYQLFNSVQNNYVFFFSLLNFIYINQIYYYFFIFIIEVVSALCLFVHSDLLIEDYDVESAPT
jgi:hypothetical protein